MTTAFRSRVVCQHCGKPTTAESAFERWFRGHPDLKSGEGIVRFDLDILLHRYKDVSDLKGDRRIQCMMFIEVKTHEAKPSKAQIDTLSMLSQILRNDMSNMHHTAPGNRSNIPAPHEVWSEMFKMKVDMFAYGGHLLRLQADDPTNSAWMTWDNRKIDAAQLIDLLRFERHPYTLRPMDKRRRSGAFSQEQTLFSQPGTIGGWNRE